MSDPSWECPNCGQTNNLVPSVVDLCVEVWESCEGCGNTYSFDLRGKSA